MRIRSLSSHETNFERKPGKRKRTRAGRNFTSRLVTCIVLLVSAASSVLGQNSSEPSQAALVSSEALGVSFVQGSTSQVIIQKNGKSYLVDLTTHAIREADAPASAQAASVSAEASSKTAKATVSPAAEEKKTVAKVYTPGDDQLFSLPTGRRLDRHGLYLNFTHRFPFESAFTGPGRGDTLLGLDDFSASSFGLRYGVTSRLSVMAYRSPSLIGRPIEMMVAYNFLDENDKQPFNAAFRFSVDGQNHFSANFTENFELVVSRSLGHRAQLYAVPTLSVHNRPLLADLHNSLAAPFPDQPCAAQSAAGIDPSFHARPCANTFSLGMGAAVDIRPTVAIVAETIPTLVNGDELGIHRPEFSFGIQKKIWRHAFTFGFTNSPGTIVSQRSGTNATFLQDSSGDKPSRMFVGFDLTRQVF